MDKKPVVFDEFFEMGLEDHVSPFLTPQSKIWGVGVMLKSSILAALFLVLSYIFRFTPGGESLSLFFLLGVYFFAGVPALIASIEDIFRLELNIDVLMTLAAFASVLIGSPHEGGMLLVLFAISGAMEDAVTDKAKGSISALYKLSPSTAHVLGEGESLREVSVKDIEVGTEILVRAQEIVPLDGDIIAGSSSVSLVHLTGENLPVMKSVGAFVPAGAQNLEGPLTLRVSKTSAESTVSKIIRLVTEASEAKPKVQKWFEKLSKGYATTVIALTAFFAAVLPSLFHIPYLGNEGSVYRAIAFLIAASPCALIIATPIAYLSAIGTLAKNGVLLKGGVVLDAIDKCSIIAFDKTGTLTTGKLSCVEIDSPNLKEAIDFAYTMERNAVHPIAEALVEYGEAHGATLQPLSDFKSIPGFGLEAKSNGKTILLGNVDFISPRLSQEKKEKLSSILQSAKKQGQVLALLLIDQDLTLFRFEDSIRPGTKHTLEQLPYRLLMLSGDHLQSAKRIANELGIDEYYAELKPQDKLRIVGELSEKEGLIMVGDGINDAPALARATVGISMGKVGSTSAIEAADAVLLHDDLDRLNFLIDKAKQTKRIVAQNLTLAASVILLATTPALLGLIPLWLAVVLHEGGTVLVGLNALRILSSPKS